MHTSPDGNEPLPEPGSPRLLRHFLTGLICFAGTIALFYLVENWRGHRVWETCKRELAAKGARLDWEYYVPPPIPDEQNAFAVPEMAKWFVKGNGGDLQDRLTYPGFPKMGRLAPDYSQSARVVLGQVTVGLPGTLPAEGAVILPWSQSSNALSEVARHLKEALGPTMQEPVWNYHFMLRRLEVIQPVRLFLRADKAPTAEERETWLRALRAELGVPDPKLESTGENAFNLTAVAPIRVTDFMAWVETIQPVLAVIRDAVKRPYARMPGNYEMPFEGPVPSFVQLRHTAQMLCAIARCQLFLGEPDKALESLSLLHHLCRLLEARPTGRPMTLVAAMIHVAMKGAYMEVVKEGMQMQGWREPQLLALQKDLEDTNLRAAVAEAFTTEQAGMIGAVERTPRAELVKFFRLAEILNSGRPAPRSFAFSLIPQGWVDQNLASFAYLEEVLKESLDRRRQDIEPRRIDAVAPTIEAAVSERAFPYRLLLAIAIPNFSKAGRTTAYNHVMVLQGRIACALERYRLKQGGYPATLDALVPEFLGKLPLDPIGSQPFHYRLKGKANYVLYSVGWNEKDDGGVASPEPVAKDGDWVWPYSGPSTP